MYECELMLLMDVHTNTLQKQTNKWSYTMTNHKTNTILRMSALLIGSASLLAATGCTCNGSAEKMQKNWDRSFQLQWKCCKALSNDVSRDECIRELQEATNNVGQNLVRWTSACVNDNQALMTSIANQITESVTSCLPSAILGSVHGAVNQNSPYRDITEITFDISPVENSAFGTDGSSMSSESQSSANSTSVLRGDICASFGDAYLCGNAKGRLSYIAIPDQNSSQNSYRPTRFNLNIGIAGVATRLKMIPHEENRLSIRSDGSGLLEVAMSMDVSASSGILQKEVWLEFPVVRTLGGVAIKSDGISGLELAPEAPPAFADWNSDGFVDDLDYAQFMVDFIAQETDLNLDRHVNDEDFTIFVDIWEGAL